MVHVVSEAEDRRQRDEYPQTPRRPPSLDAGGHPTLPFNCESISWHAMRRPGFSTISPQLASLRIGTVHLPPRIIARVVTRDPSPRRGQKANVLRVEHLNDALVELGRHPGAAEKTPGRARDERFPQIPVLRVRDDDARQGPRPGVRTRESTPMTVTPAPFAMSMARSTSW